MTGFLVRLAISAFGLWVASKLVPGMVFHGPEALILAALLQGIVNAVVRPLLVLLTLPLTILTLGLFLLVVNGITLAIVAWLLPGFELQGLGSAILGAIVASLAGWFASSVIGPTGRFELMVVRRD